MQLLIKVKYGLVAVLLASSPALAWSASATEQLRQFISKVPAATGQFQQQRLATPDAAQNGQNGTFAFKRPGQFRWDVKKPYEQLILSDGKQVYQYDPDLAQVTQRPVDQSIGASPAAILFGSGVLEDAFTLVDLPTKDGLDHMRATPRNADAGFSYVDISFQQGLPVRLDLLDSFGQTTRITLNNIVVNPTLSASEFTFTPPPGVDVVQM
ncbi:outer membrane lipoprotein chaperone LolA [Alcaligenaceae bacterium]|nr:outer membrane lipoprotein chaperone LolA [Alcaligenaceae bacterium]